MGRSAVGAGPNELRAHSTTREQEIVGGRGGTGAVVPVAVQVGTTEVDPENWTDLPHGKWTARYRSRFGIESSYRQMNRAKVTTTTRNPVVRLCLVGVAVILRNVWVWLHWEQLSMPRRGGRVIRLDRLPFKSLLLWLLHVVEERFGCCDSTRAERPPLHSLAT